MLDMLGTKGALLCRQRSDGRGGLLFEIGIEGEGGEIRVIASTSSAQFIVSVCSMFLDIARAVEEHEPTQKLIESFHRMARGHECTELDCIVPDLRDLFAILHRHIPKNGACQVHGVVFADGAGCPLCC